MKMLMEYLAYVMQFASGARIRHEREIADMRERDTSAYLSYGPTLRILDVANGRLRPQYAILSSLGYDVYGLDLANCQESGWKDPAYRIARLLFAGQSGMALAKMDRGSLICGDVACLPYPDSTFGLVTSVAAFEHFLDVPGTVAEIFRVLKPGGVVWVMVHLFTSLSGGHNVTLTKRPLRQLPGGTDAWDHLRRRRLAQYRPLNEWRQQQYCEEFSRHFEILRAYCSFPEGRELLNPEILHELKDYSPDELTCRDYVIVARKPDDLV